MSVVLKFAYSFQAFQRPPLGDSNRYQRYLKIVTPPVSIFFIALSKEVLN
jgi:hypothetical protein